MSTAVPPVFDDGIQKSCNEYFGCQRDHLTSKIISELLHVQPKQFA